LFDDISLRFNLGFIRYCDSIYLYSSPQSTCSTLSVGTPVQLHSMSATY